MNAKERERNEQWLRRMAALEDDCGDCTGGAVPYFARKFPIPDTSGLTPAEAETVLEQWRAEVRAAMTQMEQPQAEPSGTTSPAQPPATPEAPVA
jgi:hypothetical protein